VLSCNLGGRSAKVMSPCLQAISSSPSPTPTTSPRSDATQIVDGVGAPVAGTWSVDPGHTEVGVVGHLGLTNTRGRFRGVDGTVHVADHPTASTIDVTIDMASVESGVTNRHDDCRSASSFDVDSHPTAQFRSTAIAVDGNGGTVTGDLTINGITRTVELNIEYLGYARSPWGNDRVAFSASATINREDWGITKDLTLELELIRQSNRHE
jgi:polyisoprenoid-binding protein YceI